MSEKKYAIVCFVEESQVEVVPSTWLVNNTAVKWPSNCTINAIMRYIRECSLPEDDWRTISIRVLGFAKTFGNANRKATLAQDTSNIGTDSSQSEVEHYSRKRSRPHRFDSSSDEETETQREIKRHKGNKKVFQTPDAPSLRESNSSNGRIQSQESLSASTISYPNISILSNSAEDNTVFAMPSLISSPNLPKSPTPAEGNSMFALFTRVFKSLENIQRDLKMLKSEQTKVQFQLSAIINKEETSKNLYTLPDGISVPVETDSDLKQLNLLLKEDQTLTPALARYLHGATMGRTISTFLLHATKKVLHKNVAAEYSRLGRKGKKCFEAVEEVYNAILAAAALKFPDISREEIAEKFGRVLASSSDWEGSRVHKKATHDA